MMITRFMTNILNIGYFETSPKGNIFKQIDIIEIFIRSMLARLCYRLPIVQFYRLDQMCTCQQYN